MPRLLDCFTKMTVALCRKIRIYTAFIIKSAAAVAAYSFSSNILRTCSASGSTASMVPSRSTR